MAQAGLPDPIERRNLLHLPQKKPVDFAGIAERYLALGRKSDALDFAEKAPAEQKKDLVRRVREQALALGDAFLLGRLEGFEPLGEKGWREALETARRSGKLRHALRIAKRLGDAAEVAKLEELLGIAKPPAPVEPAAAHAHDHDHDHDHDHAPPAPSATPSPPPSGPV